MLVCSNAKVGSVDRRVKNEWMWPTKNRAGPVPKWVRAKKPRRNSVLAGRRVRPVHTTDLLVRDTAWIVSVYGDERSRYRWKMVGSATTYGIDWRMNGGARNAMEKENGRGSFQLVFGKMSWRLWWEWVYDYYNGGLRSGQSRWLFLLRNEEKSWAWSLVEWSYDLLGYAGLCSS